MYGSIVVSLCLFLVLIIYVHVVTGSTTCQYDYLQGFEGNDTTGNTVSGRTCGNTIPQPMSSLGMMHIQFVTDNIITDKGWIAKYETSGEP